MKAITSLFLLAVFCVASIHAQESSLSGSTQQTGGLSSSNNGPTGTGGGGLDQLGIRKYLLGPGDVLDLRVFGEPQFSGPLVVNDEGNVEVPFIDDPVPARCRTDLQIKQDVVKALKTYLKNPQVSMRVTELRSRPPAVVFGAVRAAQRVQMNRKAKLLELLAFAGGVTEQAGGQIQVFHTEPVMCTEPGEEVVEPPTVPVAQDDLTQVPYVLYNLADLKIGKEEANPVIRPGDIVIVQEAAPVYVTGAVVAPQGIYLREGKMPLTRAVAMVGGLRKEAKASAIRIYRLKPGTKQEQEMITVDFNAIRKQKQDDFQLQPYDVIEVVDNSGSIGNTFRNLLMGTGAGALTGLGQNLPLRVLY